MSATKPAMAKATCNGCKEEFECPKSMLRAKKHYCWVCCELMEDGVLEKDLERQRKLRGPEIEAESLRQSIAGTLTDAVFPRLWKEKKWNFDNTDKENAAWEAHAAGAEAMLELLTLQNPHSKETLQMLAKLKEGLEKAREEERKKVEG